MTGVRSIEAVAAGLTAAFAVGDLDQLAPLLAPDVRWGGGEDTGQTCHGRTQVLAWYRRLQVQGVRVQVLGTEIRGDTVVLRMAVQWPEGWDEEDLRRATRAQAFQVRDGVVVDIRDEHRIRRLDVVGHRPRRGCQRCARRAALRASRRRVASGMGRRPAGVS